MGSRPCNRVLRRCAAAGTMLCVLPGLLGCGSTQTPEQAAQSYLEETYGAEFEVGELTRKDAGELLTSYSSGYAWKTELPNDKFVVWVEKDGKTVHDTYYCVALLPAIREWVQDAADQVWDQSKTDILVSALKANDSADYHAEDIESFYENESVENTVYLVLRESDSLYEEYCAFDDAIGGMLSGYVQIRIVTDEEYDQAEAFDLYEAEADISIHIGSSREVIREKIQEWEGK